MDFNKYSEQEKRALMMIGDEYQRAQQKFPPFKSPHEAYAIILEELNEFWHLVQNHDKSWAGRDAMKQEIQVVGAMAMRFIIDM